MLSIASVEGRVAGKKYFSDISGSFVVLPMKGDIVSCFERRKNRFGATLNAGAQK